MTDEQRRQDLECRARIYALRGETVALDLMNLLVGAVERGKVSLLTADAGEVVKLQGKCAAYRDVLKWLTEPVNQSVDKP